MKRRSETISLVPTVTVAMAGTARSASQKHFHAEHGNELISLLS